jgi:16S rRNA (guanine527-N7)-methyltransferase
VEGDLTQELERALPRDLPRRAAILAGARRHAELVLAANERLNLTGITGAHDVAIKHVLDCLLPWQRLVELAPPPAAGAMPPVIADLGSGAGYPGILLAMLLPKARVLLIESTGRKAAFLEDAVRALGLRNCEVHAMRAEDLLATRDVDLVVARAVGNLRDLLRLLKRARGRFRRLVLYKGPGVEKELAQAAKDAARFGLEGAITFRGELPEGAGARFLVEYAPGSPARSPYLGAAGPGLP